MIVLIETGAGLIEGKGAQLCLGIDAGCLSPAWVTFTNEGAIRFARKQDAENFIKALKAFGIKGDPFSDVVITSHQWG